MYRNNFVSKSYLVVDDFGDMRSMIKGLLRTLGATEIDAARNGKEALEKIARKRYDVILCDYNLGPGRDGQQVLEEARHRKLLSVAAVFVMVTAENTRDMVMGAFDHEPDSYLSKPFTKELLRTRLDKLFPRKADLVPVNTALEKGAFKQALALLDGRILAKPPNLADLIRLKAEVSMQANAFDQALAIYERVLADRDVPWARLGLGRVQYAKKQYAEAAETFRQLIVQHPSLTTAYDWLARAQRASGSAAEARDTLQTAVQLSPKSVRRQQDLADLAMQTGAKELAERSYGNAARLGLHSVHNSPAIYTGLARAKSAVGKHDEAMGAVQTMGKTFADDPRTPFYAAAAEAAVRQEQGDTEAAAACLDKAQGHFAAVSRGGTRDMALELARTSAQLGRCEQAEQILHSAVRNNHEDSDYLVAVTDTLRQAGIGDNPEGMVMEIRQTVVDMNNRGVRLMRDSLYDDAIELFESAVEKMPYNLLIILNAARAQIIRMEQRAADAESISRVRRHIERARNIAPGDERLRQLLHRLQRLVANS